MDGFDGSAPPSNRPKRNKHTPVFALRPLGLSCLSSSLFFLSPSSPLHINYHSFFVNGRFPTSSPPILSSLSLILPPFPPLLRNFSSIPLHSSFNPVMHWLYLNLSRHFLLPTSGILSCQPQWQFAVNFFHCIGLFQLEQHPFIASRVPGMSDWQPNISQARINWRNSALGWFAFHPPHRI